MSDIQRSWQSGFGAPSNERSQQFKMGARATITAPGRNKSIWPTCVSSCWRFICLCILCGNKEKAFRLLVHLGCIAEAAVCILCGNKEKASPEFLT